MLCQEPLLSECGDNKVVRDIKTPAKEANRVQRMETKFQPTKHSIKDVSCEVQKEVSKFQTAKNKQSSRKPADTRGPCSNSRSTSRDKAKSGQSLKGKMTWERKPLPKNEKFTGNS